MKNLFKLFGIINLVALIGFSMIACDLFNDEEPSLDGVWEQAISFNIINAKGIEIEIRGDKGTFKSFGTTPNQYTQSAINKGIIKVGDTAWRNIETLGDKKWKGEILYIVYDSESFVATDTKWKKFELLMSISEKSIYLYDIDDAGKRSETSITYDKKE
jgi:hypothetical protein